MKQLLSFALMLALSIALNAQTRPADRLFEKIALRQGITMMSFSKEMLDAVNLNFDYAEGTPESNMRGDLHEVKLVIYKTPENEKPMAFRKTALSYLPLSQYTKIEDNSSEEDVDIRILRKGKKVSECHVLFQGEANGVLLSFFGNFKIDDVHKLAEKVDQYK